MGEITNGRVEDVTLSKKKTSLRVRIGDDWYGAYLPKKDDEDIQAALGKMVAVEWEDKGNFGKWINRWRFSADQTQPAGARPITPHQGAAQAESPKGTGSGVVAQTPEPARQLSAEELKVVNGLTMGIVQHWLPAHEGSFTDKLELIQLAMKAIATTVREL